MASNPFYSFKNERVNILYHICLWLFLPFLSFSQTDQKEAYFKKSHHEIMEMAAGMNTAGPDVSQFRYATKLYYSKAIKSNSDERMTKRVFTLSSKGRSVPFTVQPKNEELDMAFITMNVKGDRIYYSLEREETEERKAFSQIWYRNKNFSGKWDAPVRLPKELHLNQFPITHPSAGILRDSRKKILFFVGDLRNGKGGTDIWMIEEKGDDEFTQPISLSFNSAEDEAAPFFDVFNQTLYFSSKGNGTHGGFDIFRSQYKGNGNWGKPENLGRPINSFYDDLHFSFNDRGRHVYFSSDRPNDSCPTGAPSCRHLDIYKVQLKATLQVYLFDEETKLRLDGCNVELEEMATQKIVTTYLDLESNFASVGLDSGKNYNLIISKKGYFPLTVQVDTEGKDFFKPTFEQYNLRPMSMGSETLAAVKPVAKTFSSSVPDLTAKGGGENPIPETSGFDNSETISSADEMQTNLSVPTTEAEIVEEQLDISSEVKESSIAIKEQPKIEKVAEPVLEKEELKPPVVQNTIKKENIIAKKNTGNIDLKKSSISKKENEFLLSVKNQFESLGTSQYSTVTNVPLVALNKENEPVDLLFYHDALSCYVVFDKQQTNFKLDNVEKMDTYLSFITGYKRKGQQPSIGITLFYGGVTDVVVYSFLDANATLEKPSYIHTFLLPKQYQGVLPGPDELVNILKD